MDTASKAQADNMILWFAHKAELKDQAPHTGWFAYIVSISASVQCLVLVLCFVSFGTVV
jgi:hypothetical protein